MCVCVALAGILGTVRAQGRPLTDFVNQKIVVVGAGRYFTCKTDYDEHNIGCSLLLLMFYYTLHYSYFLPQVFLALITVQDLGF